MIQLEHINLVVKNIPEMLKFYQSETGKTYKMVPTLVR